MEPEDGSWRALRFFGNALGAVRCGRGQLRNPLAITAAAVTRQTLRRAAAMHFLPSPLLVLEVQLLHVTVPI
ncbi:hypothetical protein EVAR_67064_1 [Eumeta japonica]|uniref:Uncharacterized protein n=1 Tax=Eumeta variegata TaxID=151549 RepID=A0A4C1ZJ77_EUMVA|nr:hypothetical protein EVAR_67064_1 [Eumeta japonica]